MTKGEKSIKSSIEQIMWNGIRLCPSINEQQVFILTFLSSTYHPLDRLALIKVFLLKSSNRHIFSFHSELHHHPSTACTSSFALEISFSSPARHAISIGTHPRDFKPIRPSLARYGILGRFPPIQSKWESVYFGT